MHQYEVIYEKQAQFKNGKVFTQSVCDQVKASTPEAALKKLAINLSGYKKLKPGALPNVGIKTIVVDRHPHERVYFIKG